MKIDLDKMRATHLLRKECLASSPSVSSDLSGKDWWLDLPNLSEVSTEIIKMILEDGKVMAIRIVKEMLPQISISDAKRFVEWVYLKHAEARYQSWPSW